MFDRFDLSRKGGRRRGGGAGVDETTSEPALPDSCEHLSLSLSRSLPSQNGTAPPGRQSARLGLAGGKGLEHARGSLLVRKEPAWEPGSTWVHDPHANPHRSTAQHAESYLALAPTPVRDPPSPRPHHPPPRALRQTCVTHARTHRRFLGNCCGTRGGFPGERPPSDR